MSEIAAAGEKRRGYVTFLAGNGDYVMGVVALAKGLRKVKSAYPLVVAVLPDVPEDHRKLLVAQGCILRDIEPVYPPAPAVFARDYYVINYSKIRIWEFVEYSKMVYLDGDIQVFGNIDELFELPEGRLYGVMSCLCEKHWSYTPEYKMGYCQLHPASGRQGDQPAAAAACYINAGMLVYEPNISTYRDLLYRVLPITPPTPFAEQDLLNTYFKQVITPIPNVYNLLVQMLWRHPDTVHLHKVKVVHYCINGSKPWRYTGKEENMEREDIKMLVSKWWDIYNDSSLDFHPNPNNPNPKQDDICTLKLDKDKLIELIAVNRTA